MGLRCRSLFRPLNGSVPLYTRVMQLGQSASSGHHSRAIVGLHFSQILAIGPWSTYVRASLDDYDHGLVIQDLTRRQEQVAERLTEDGYLKLPKFDPNHGKLLDRRAIETDGGCNS
jgi:hypothetical protein